MPEREDEVWRLPARVRGEDVRLSGGGSVRPSPALSAAAKARLARIVRGAPEVMVKVTGRSRGIAGFKAHLQYITRNGRLLGETQDGEPVQDRAGLRRLHDDWLLTNAVIARGRTDAQASQTVGVILSMPAGVSPDRVHDATRTWARETFGERHDWLLVRHEDRKHPHVHVTVRAVGSDGRRLAPGPAELQQWRERFAQELRRFGIAAEATPRQARGKVQRSERAAVYRIEQRGAEPQVRRLQRDDAARAARSPRLPEPREWQRDIQARQERIRRAYLAHAAHLDDRHEPDRLLAEDIRRFVANMPVPLTRREALATELRRVLGQHRESTPAENAVATAEARLREVPVSERQEVRSPPLPTRPRPR